MPPEHTFFAVTVYRHEASKFTRVYFSIIIRYMIMSVLLITIFVLIRVSLNNNYSPIGRLLMPKLGWRLVNRVVMTTLHIGLVNEQKW